jgi:hypothetical protein
MKMAIRSKNIVILVFMLFLFNCNDDSNNIKGDQTYSVKYDLGGGSGVTPKTQNVLAGTVITLPSAEGLIAPSGKIFLGWAAEGKIYPAGTSYSVLKDVTFAAFWADKTIKPSTVDPPTVFSAVLVSSNCFFFHWQDVIGATKYQMYRSAELLGKYDKLDKYEKSESGTYTSAIIIQPHSVTYYYKVASIDSLGKEGDPSSPFAVTTPRASNRIKIINYYADKKESIVYVKIISVDTETGITNTYLEESTSIPPGEIKIYEDILPGYYRIEVKFESEGMVGSVTTGHLSINTEAVVTFKNYSSAEIRKWDYTYGTGAFVPPEW